MKKICLFICLTVLFACSSEIEEKPFKESPVSSISSSSILVAQEKAKMLFTPSNQATRATDGLGDYPYEEASEIIDYNMQYAVTNDIYALLIKNGYREELADASYDYYCGTDFARIIEKYNITEDELQFVANICGCIDYIKATSTRASTKVIVACSLAVAGSVVCTISAIGIATPQGLGIWLVGKAIATASLAFCA